MVIHHCAWEAHTVMMSDTDLRIVPFNQIRMNHPCYIVPAFLDIPVCETKSMLLLRKDLRLRRKTIERIKMAQNPGNIFTLNGTKNRSIFCVVLAESAETLSYNTLKSAIANAVRYTIEDTAVIGDGFRLTSKSKSKDDVHNGFELLCRSLRRLGFVGTVYEPPEYLMSQRNVSGFPDERITDTHTILRADGTITPSLFPTMLKLRK